MRKIWLGLAVGIPVLAIVGALAFGSLGTRHASADASSCVPTGFTRGGKNLTAAVMNPGKPVTGAVNATGCNIGVYFGPGTHGSVSHAEIWGANYFGVVNNGASVSVSDSKIHNIGDNPLSGNQYGVGVYFAFDSGASGRISGNQIWRYQKGGIVVNGPSDSATVDGNTVTGLGPTPMTAQNGIQIGFGASASVMANTVSDNSYMGTGTVASGIVVVGGPYYEIYFGSPSPYTVGTQIVGNTVVNNDIGVFLTNLDANGGPPASLTNVAVINNSITDGAMTNNYFGCGGYQAGVSDVGNNDKIVHNTISGVGYTPTTASCAYLIAIDADVSFTNRPKVHANVLG